MYGKMADIENTKLQQTGYDIVLQYLQLSRQNESGAIVSGVIDSAVVQPISMPGLRSATGCSYT
jgi:hypothetical protein